MISDKSTSHAGLSTKTPARSQPVQTQAKAQVKHAAPGDKAGTTSVSMAQVRSGKPKESAGPNQPALANQAKHASQNQGKTLTEPHDIYRHELSSTPGAKEQLAKLTPEQRSTFRELVLSEVVDGTEVNTGQGTGMMGAGFGGMAGMAKGKAADLSEQEKQELQKKMAGTSTRAGLMKLLSDGKLTSTDSRGKTLLDNLDSLKHQEMSDCVDCEKVFQGTVRDLAYQTPKTGNIAKSELVSKLASEEPAEYTRLISGLASPNGETKLGKVTLAAGGISQSEGPFAPSQSSELLKGALNERQARTELFQREISSEPKARREYAELSVDDRRKYYELYQDSVPKGDFPESPAMNRKPGQAMTTDQKKDLSTYTREMMELQNRAASRQNLVSLLEDGKMGATDSNGGSLIQNLDRIKNQKMASEGVHTMDGSTVVSELVRQIDDPGMIRQNNKGTCTVTTVEHLLATKQPAEYARIVGDLTSENGKVRLQDGTTVQRDQKLVAADDSGRSSASRVFQATMMEYGNGAEIDYRNDKDGHYLRSNGEAILDSDGDLSGGLYADQWKRVSDSVLGTESENKWARGTPRAEIESDMKDALAEGSNLQVSLRWSLDKENKKHGNHALSVTGIDDKYVYLRNPWGGGDSGNDDETVSLRREAVTTASHKRESAATGAGIGFGFGFIGEDKRAVVSESVSTGEAGSIRVTKEDFYKNLNHYLVDTPPEEKSWYSGLLEKFGFPD